MKMKELCEKTGLQDRTIRFYISSGLLLPSYNENYAGRRNFNFSEKDVTRLKQIMLLRKYNFSLNDIKTLYTDFSDFDSILVSHLEKMEHDNAQNQKLTDDLISIRNIHPQNLEDFCGKLENIDYIKSLSVENENDSNAAYRLVYQKSKKKYRILIAVIVAAAVLFAGHEWIDLFYIGTPTGYAFIESGGSHIELYSQRYIPIEIKGCHVKTDDEIVEFKYIFSDELPIFHRFSIYEIDNVKNNELIYLKTHDKSKYPRYYVLEEKYDYYKSLIDHFQEHGYACALKGMGGKEYVVEANRQIKNMVDCVRLSESGFSYDENKNYYDARILAYDESGIFYRVKGRIIYEENKYYYISDENAQVYDISQDCYNMLDIMFEYNMR